MRYATSKPHSPLEGESQKAKPDAVGGHRSFITRLLAGEYGLAVTFWILYFLGAGLFFAFGSRAVNRDEWLFYLIMVVAMLVYTVMLIIGVRATYKGPQLWKVMSRTSSVFMIVNILVGICTLGFVY